MSRKIRSRVFWNVTFFINHVNLQWFQSKILLEHSTGMWLFLYLTLDNVVSTHNGFNKLSMYGFWPGPTWAQNLLQAYNCLTCLYLWGPFIPMSSCPAEAIGLLREQTLARRSRQWAEQMVPYSAIYWLSQYIDVTVVPYDNTMPSPLLLHITQQLRYYETGLGDLIPAYCYLKQDNNMPNWTPW